MRERILAPDDLQRGMYIRVQGPKKQAEAEEIDMGEVMLRVVTSMESSQLNSMILRVEHVDLPHIAFRCACGDRGCKLRGAIDTRRFELVEISRDFAMAMRPRRWWQFWKR